MMAILFVYLLLLLGLPSQSWAGLFRKKTIHTKESLVHSTTLAAASDPALIKLKATCKNNQTIDSITAAPTKNGGKFFTQKNAGISRFQTLCLQIDVDLFELAAIIASAGSAAPGPTSKLMPFKTTISFGLNLQITYGSCKAGKCPLSLLAEGSIGVGVALKLGNLKSLQATVFSTGSIELSSDDAELCDPAVHGGASAISPVSFNCGAGWLLGAWYTQFFSKRLSKDPTFSVTAYRDLIQDITRLSVEETEAEEHEVVAGLLTDMRLSRRLFNEEQKQRKEGRSVSSNDPMMLSKIPLYNKGALLNYKHTRNAAPVFWAESKLAQVDLQHVFEVRHMYEYNLADLTNPAGCTGSFANSLRCTTRAKLIKKSPFLQLSSKHVIEMRKPIGFQQKLANNNPASPLRRHQGDEQDGGDGKDGDDDSTLEYTGSNVYQYILKRSDRLKVVYKQNKFFRAPTTRAYPFFKAQVPGCQWNNNGEAYHDKKCFAVHPGLPLNSNNLKGAHRVAWSGGDGLFAQARSLWVLRRTFIWYIRWLLEIRVLSSYFWPSSAADQPANKRNFPTRLDTCSDLPVSFEDAVHHKKKESAGMQLAKEWGLVSCSNGPQKDCFGNYKYVWNPRYFCHVGNMLSKIPTTPDACQNPTARGCIHLNRPQFSRTEECKSDDSGEDFLEKEEPCRTRVRPMSRYLYVSGQTKPEMEGSKNDPYLMSGHDELFPDEYVKSVFC